MDHPALRANIERRGERTWLYTAQRVVVPPVQPGAMAVYEIPVKRVGPGREMISSMESESPDVFDAQLLGVRQEGRETIVRFGITPKLAQDGAYMGNVRFRSEQFSAPLVVIGAVRAPGATP